MAHLMDIANTVAPPPNRSSLITNSDVMIFRPEVTRTEPSEGVGWSLRREGGGVSFGLGSYFGDKYMVVG